MADVDDARAIGRLREAGWVVLPDLLSSAEVVALREALAPIVEANGFGRNPFEGRRTERVYALLAKCPAVAPLVEHPRILALADAFLESAQALHCDDDAGAPSRPRPPQGLSTVWALDDFRAENGATRLVPGSHRWGAERVLREEDAVPVEMSAGSVVVYLGGVHHGGGAHTGRSPRLGISLIYCQPWLRQFENQVLAVPPEKAARYSERIQRMLGYGMLGPMGTVDGRDPIRLVEAARRAERA